MFALLSNASAVAQGPVQAGPAREMLRHGALSLLATFYKATGQMETALARNRVQFLYLHHLPESERPAFRNLLKRLSSGHRFISYSEGVNRIVEGNIDGPYIALSFDDGLKDCLIAAEVMEEFGISACFFVSASVIGETNSAKVKQFCSEQLNIPPTDFLSWTDIDSLLKAGHEIGSHTMRHLNLATLSHQELEVEVGGSFEELSRRLGSVQHFAWPYGLFSDFNSSAARVVFQTGFKSCASAERGCHVTQADPHFCIRRDNTVASWPLDHILYLIARNSQQASAQTNEWPRTIELGK